MTDGSAYLKLLDKRTAEMSASFAQDHADCEALFLQAFEHLTWTVTHLQIREHRRQISAAALTSRILHQTHATHNLLRAGNLSGAAVILRSLLESVFAVVALSRNCNFEEGRDFFMRLRYKTAHTDRQAIKKFLSTATSLNEAQHRALAEKQDKLKKWMTEHNRLVMTTVREVAEAANMLDFYAREYAIQSKPTHSDIEDVVNTHVAERDGKLVLLAAVVSHARVPELSTQLVTMLMETASALIGMFKLELSQEAADRQSVVACGVASLFERASVIRDN